MTRTTAKSLAALFTLLVFFHCENPFATRTAEPPRKSQSNWIQPTSPAYVIINLKNAMQEKNKSNYLRCLADTSVSIKDFLFFPEPAVANANPGVFDRWSKDAESNYINQLYSYLEKEALTDHIDLARGAVSATRRRVNGKVRCSQQCYRCNN